MPGARPASWHQRGGDDGAVLLIVLVMMSLVAAAAMMMLALTDVERSSAGSFRDSTEAFYAADAALEVTIDELGAMPSWTPLLAGGVSLRWTAAGVAPALKFGGALDLPALTSGLQREAARTGLGPNTPVWRLVGHAPLGAVWSGAGPAADIYLAVWAADDSVEEDGDPGVDANGTLQVRAEAWGRRQTRRAVEAVISRGDAGVIRQVSWREVR